MILLSFAQKALFASWFRFYDKLAQLAGFDESDEKALNIHLKHHVKDLKRTWKKYQEVRKAYDKGKLSEIVKAFKKMRKGIDPMPTVHSVIKTVLLDCRVMSHGKEELTYFNRTSYQSDLVKISKVSIDLMAADHQSHLPVMEPFDVKDPAYMSKMVRSVGVQLILQIVIKQSLIVKFKLEEKLKLVEKMVTDGKSEPVHKGWIVKMMDSMTEDGKPIVCQLTDEKPLVQELLDDLNLSHKCSFPDCKETDKGLETCSRCRSELYCAGSDCNQKDWKEHKKRGCKQITLG